VDFLALVVLLRGESVDPGLAGISSSCSASAFEPVCISNTALAALSLLTQDCRECTTGTDFNEDTGDEGFDDTDESGDLGSCADFLEDGCVAFGFFVYQQRHGTVLIPSIETEHTYSQHLLTLETRTKISKGNKCYSNSNNMSYNSSTT